MSAEMQPLARQALVKANEIRCGRAQIKRELKAGQLTLAQLLDDIPPCCAKVPVHEALTWLPRIGNTKARKLAGPLVSETLPLAALGPGSRRRLLERAEANGVAL